MTLPVEDEDEENFTPDTDIPATWQDLANEASFPERARDLLLDCAGLIGSSEMGETTLKIKKSMAFTLQSKILELLGYEPTC